MLKILAAILLSAVCWQGLLAADAPKSKWDSLKTYFEHLKQGLSESSLQGRYQKRSFVAVAAVRGSAQKDEKSDLDKPQMKDPVKARRIKVKKAESREFEKAVELAVSGKFEEAVAALEAFEKAHPQSPFIDDVRDAKARAKEALEAQKAEAAQPKAAE